MAAKDFIKTPQELDDIADMLSEELQDDKGDVIARYQCVTSDGARFNKGRSIHAQSNRVTLNKEYMDAGIFTCTEISDLCRHNAPEVRVTRDQMEYRFNFMRKNVPLPADTRVYHEPIPAGADTHDAEFLDYTRTHHDSGFGRDFSVFQQVVVNSCGGRAIQTIAAFGIGFGHGYNPIPLMRNISVVTRTEDDIRRIPVMVAYMPDPTPGKRIAKRTTFTDAFHELESISPLRYGSLADAGVKDSALHDVAVLSGVSIHEVFGHHMEEPFNYLSQRDSGAFRQGMSIDNKGVDLKDDPSKTLAGFNLSGFTHFDAYGRPRAARQHIKDGKVVGFLGGEYADLRNLRTFMNVNDARHIGNTVQDIENSMPQTRMSCTVLGGMSDPVDLEGHIIVIPDGGHTDPQDKTYNIRASECYVIRDGEPMRVIPLEVSGGILQALVNMTLLPDVTYQNGNCYKQSPIRHAHASVPVSQVAHSQLWCGQQVQPRPPSDRHLKILISR